MSTARADSLLPGHDGAQFGLAVASELTGDSDHDAIKRAIDSNGGS